MAIKEENNEEKKSISFVEQLVEEDLAQGKNGSRIQTISILDTQKQYAWTSVLLKNITAFVISDSMIRTQVRKIMNMLKTSLTTFNGLDSNGDRFIMLQIISKSYGSLLFG